MHDPFEPSAGSYAGPPIPEARQGPLDAPVAIALLQRAQSLADQGDWPLAATTFARVVGNGDPNLHVAALLGLAESRYRLDDDAGALQCWLSATQAPETPLAWRAWKALAAARVRSGDMTGAARAYREAERRAPPSERPEISSRLGWLSKEAGDLGAAGRHFRRSRTNVADGPVVTWAIMAVTIAIGVSSLLLDQSALWERWLALTKVGVQNGEYWRLFTVVLVHDASSPLHLAFNMYALWIIGPVVEALYGRSRYLLIYLACAAAGSTASFVFSDALVSVGASGAIFGLFGVLLTADRVHKPALTRRARGLTTQIVMLIVINLGFGLVMENIDNAAHVGGLLAGCWLGILLVPRGATTLRSLWTPAPGRDPAHADRYDGTRVVRLLGLVLLVAVIAVGVSIRPFALG